MALSFPEVVGRPLFEPHLRWPMGVRSLPPEEWLQVDDARDEDLALKEQLRAAAPDEVTGWLDGSAAAGAELLELVDAELARRDLPRPARGRHPIDTAGRGVQEDLCLMERQGERWILTAGSVCFPTRWELGEKLGCSLAEIHAPVPGYATDLEATVDRFFDRMAPGTLAHRLNWSIVGSGARRLPAADRQAPAEVPTDLGQHLFVRVERQTLRRLVDHTAVVFGIRIHSWPLATVVDSIDATRAAAMLASLPDPVVVYKNLESVRRPLIDWFHTQGEG